jgi:hypothetical protein
VRVQDYIMGHTEGRGGGTRLGAGLTFANAAQWLLLTSRNRLAAPCAVCVEYIIRERLPVPGDVLKRLDAADVERLVARQLQALVARDSAVLMLEQQARRPGGSRVERGGAR